MFRKTDFFWAVFKKFKLFEKRNIILLFILTFFLNGFSYYMVFGAADIRLFLSNGQGLDSSEGLGWFVATFFDITTSIYFPIFFSSLLLLPFIVRDNIQQLSSDLESTPISKKQFTNILFLNLLIYTLVIVGAAYFTRLLYSLFIWLFYIKFDSFRFYFPITESNHLWSNMLEGVSEIESYYKFTITSVFMEILLSIVGTFSLIICFIYFHQRKWVPFIFATVFFVLYIYISDYAYHHLVFFHLWIGDAFIGLPTSILIANLLLLVFIICFYFFARKAREV